LKGATGGTEETHQWEGGLGKERESVCGLEREREREREGKRRKTKSWQ